MADHIHIGFMFSLIVFLGLIPFSFLWNYLKAYLTLNNHPAGKAMAGIY